MRTGRPKGAKDLKPRKCRSVENRFWEKVYKTETCWNWTGALDGWGYGVIAIPRVSVAYKAHRLSWEMHKGKIPAGLFVCHHCDNPRCVRPDHLFTGTAKHNSEDMIYKGRWKQPPQPLKDAIRRGEKVNFAKLTEAKVFQLRRLALMGVSAYRMSKWIRLTHTGIRLILRGVNWAHVPFPRHEKDTLEEVSA